jgi:two-component system CheB/CheR fusion protein
VLVSAGHTVEVFTDPAAAVAQAEAQHFDILVTDLAMPGMAGWQVARAVKAAQPEIAVILMTGYGVELSSEEREVHSVDAVLTKPVGVNAILDAVVRITTKQPKGRA